MLTVTRELGLPVLVHERNVQAVDLPWLLHDADYDSLDKIASIAFPWYLNAKQAEAMRGEYIPMILSQRWIIGFEKASEMSSEIASEFGFFPVSAKMKAQWACANIFRRQNLLYMLFHFFIYLLHLWWQSSNVEWRPEPSLESIETSVERPSRWLGSYFV